MAPRRAAFSITVFGPSTWQVMTSTPCVDQAVGGFRFLHRHRPVAGEDHLHGRVRIGEPGAEHEGVDVAQHLRDRLGGDEAELAGLGGVAGDDAGDVLRLVDIAEIAAGVLRVLLRPQPAGMLEARLGKFVGELDHVRAEVAERGREQERGAVEIDHQLHGLLDRVGFRDLLLLDHLDAGHLLQRRGAGGVRLVVAVVVARADIDEADDGILGEGGANRQRRGKRRGGGALQQMAAGNRGKWHGLAPGPGSNKLAGAARYLRWPGWSPGAISQAPCHRRQGLLCPRNFERIRPTAMRRVAWRRDLLAQEMSKIRLLYAMEWAGQQERAHP